MLSKDLDMFLVKMMLVEYSTSPYYLVDWC